MTPHQQLPHAKEKQEEPPSAPEEMKQAIWTAKQAASLDPDYHLRGRIITIGSRFGFTEEALIAGGLLSPPNPTNPQKRKGG
jgi:hypothetical protein